MKKLLGSTLACGALLFSAGCAAESGVEAIASRANETQGLPALEQRIGEIRQYFGPIVVDWESCPEGDQQLADNMHVLAPSAPWNFGGGFVEIGEDLEVIEEVSNGGLNGLVAVEEGREQQPTEQYNNAFGQAVAFCGTSVGSYPNLGILGPSQGTVVVMPVDPECVPIEGQTTPPNGCTLQPILFDVNEFATS